MALGPNALALAADLMHRYGMAYREVAALLGTYVGIRVTHGAHCGRACAWPSSGSGRTRLRVQPRRSTPDDSFGYLPPPRRRLYRVDRRQRLGHLIRRCTNLLAIRGAAGSWYPLALMRARQQVIAHRKRRDELAASTAR